MTTSPLEVGAVAKCAALTWLHHKSEREVMMTRELSEWPIQTQHLAKHIQDAIDTANIQPYEVSKHWVPSEEEEARMRE